MGGAQGAECGSSLIGSSGNRAVERAVEAHSNLGRVSNGAKVSGSGFEGSVQERLWLGTKVFRHRSSGTWFSEARTRTGARFGTRSMSTARVGESESWNQHPAAQERASSEAVPGEAGSRTDEQRRRGAGGLSGAIAEGTLRRTGSGRDGWAARISR